MRVPNRTGRKGNVVKTMPWRVPSWPSTVILAGTLGSGFNNRPDDPIEIEEEEDVEQEGILIGIPIKDAQDGVLTLPLDGRIILDSVYTADTLSRLRMKY